MSGRLLLCLIWVSIAIFLIGIFYRVLMLLRLPPHLRWELAPIPHLKKRENYGGSYLEDFEWWNRRHKVSKAGALLYMLKEVLLFYKVLRCNRYMWPFSLALHLGIYFLFLAVLFSLMWAIGSLIGYRAIVTDISLDLSYYCGFAASLMGALGSIALLLKRLVNRNLVWANSAERIFNLFLLCAVFVSGSYVGLQAETTGARFASLIRGAIGFDTTIEADFALKLHLVLFLTFCAWLPFSSMSHFIAKYFTFHRILWDDQPLNERLEKDVQCLLTQPVYWAAKHAGAGKGRKWMEIVE